MGVDIIHEIFQIFPYVPPKSSDSNSGKQATAHIIFRGTWGPGTPLPPRAAAPSAPSVVWEPDFSGFLKHPLPPLTSPAPLCSLIAGQLTASWPDLNSGTGIKWDDKPGLFDRESCDFGPQPASVNLFLGPGGGGGALNWAGFRFADRVFSGRERSFSTCCSFRAETFGPGGLITEMLPLYESLSLVNLTIIFTRFSWSSVNFRAFLDKKSGRPGKVCICAL